MENSLCPVYGRVYLITNLVNGKVYVGQTVAELKKRLRNHVSHAIVHPSGKYKGRDTPLFKAIRKYGKENFKIEPVCLCASKEELDMMEDFYMLLLGGYSKRSTGYNLRRGGGNGKMSEEVKAYCGSTHKGRKHTPEARKKMSESTKRQLALNPRPPVSEETKRKMSLIPRLPRTEEWKQNMREMFSGEKGTAYNSEVSTQEVVSLYELGYSCRAVGEKVGMTDSGVRKRLKSAGVTRRNPRFRRKLIPN